MLFAFLAGSAVYAEAVPLADPFILLHEGKYYAYGTYSADGIIVFTSDDLKTWKQENLALKRGDVWGNYHYWAPEVYKTGDGFLMYYSAEEHICAARSKSPLGPFTQIEKTPMLPEEKAIDHTLFIDDDGTPWIFFDRFKNGLSIWRAQLENDLVTIKKETMKQCVSPEQPWEKKDGHVNEGSAVLKHSEKYFLTYSGNGYTSPFYGIGCAVTNDINGKWVKDERNPLLQKVGGLSGVGHHAFFRDKEGKLRIVFHAHYSNKQVHPRLMHISSVEIQDGKIFISPDFFTPQIAK
jgi:beta-xylosidase